MTLLRNRTWNIRVISVTSRVKLEWSYLWGSCEVLCRTEGQGMNCHNRTQRCPSTVPSGMKRRRQPLPKATALALTLRIQTLWDVPLIGTCSELSLNNLNICSVPETGSMQSSCHTSVVWTVSYKTMCHSLCTDPVLPLNQKYPNLQSAHKNTWEEAGTWLG